MDDPAEGLQDFSEAQLGARRQDGAFGMDPVTGNIPLTMQSPAIQSYLLQQSLQNGGQLHPGARLLPPDHFMRSSIGGAGDGPLSSHVASQASTLQNGALNSLLMNVDISTSNFSRAINFEALSDGQNPEHLAGDHGGHQEDDLEDYSEAGDSSCIEQELDVSNTDLFEQQQAREQARLLERFHQLRQWQQQQQQALVQQQQQQLQKLQGEQHRIQQMITKQRQMQWGGGVPKNGVVNQPLPQSPPKSLKKSTKRTSSLPHAIAQSSLQVAMAKANVLRTDDSMTQQPMESTPVKKGRPLPNLCPQPPTPVEYLENGNPYLDSDSATLDSRSNHTDEGVRPLLDPAGSDAHARGLQGGMMMPQNLGPLPRGNVAALPPQNVPFASYQMGGDPSGMGRMHGQYMQNGQLFYDQRRNGDVAVNVPGRTVVVPRMADPQDYGVDDVLDYREEEEEEEVVADEDDDAEDGERKEFDEGHSPALSQDSLTENAHSQGQLEERSSSPANFDDKPVGGRQKTFEELLEEELRKEEERIKEQADTPSNPTGSTGRKCFLKKGEGVARYGIQLPKPVTSRVSNTKQPVQPQPKQSHSHSKQSQTKPSTSGGAASKTSSHQHAVKASSNSSVSTGKKSGHTSAQPQEKLQLKPFSPAKKKSPQQTQNKQEKRKNTATTTQTAAPTEDPQSVQDSVAETSFHKNIKQLEKKEKVEEKELEEFELLEMYADDNASFLSNVSAVNRVLQEKQQELNRLPVHQNNKRRALASANQQQQQPFQQVEEILADTDGDADSLDSDTESASSESEEDSEDERMENRFSPNARTQNSVQRKTVSLNARPTHEQQSPLNKVQHFSDSETTAEEEEEEEEDEDDEEEEEEERERNEFTQQGRVSNLGQGKGHRPDAQSLEGHHQQQQQHLSRVKGHSSQQYTQVQTSGHQSNVASRQHGQFSQGHKNANAISHRKDDRQIDSGRWNSQKAENARLNHSSENQGRVETFESEEEEDDSDKENVRRSPTEQEKSDDDLQSPSRSRDNVLMRAIDFEDEEEWDDTLREDEDEETPVKVEQQRAPSSEGKRSAFTKVKVNADSAGRKPAALDEESVPRAETPPPTSKLVSKLFPKLKPDKPKATVQQTQQLEQAKKVEVGDAVQSQALREKLAELEREIQRFREENTTLAKLRKEREEALEHIKREMSELEKQKSEELQRLQDFKNEETKKLKRERKQFEQYQKATRAIPDKRDRREIEELKAQLAELQEEVKRKEQRWTANTTRLRDRIEILESENAELKQELKIVEKKRLEAWQHKDVVLRKENVLKVAAARVASHQPKKTAPPPAKPAIGQSSQIPRPESQPRAEHERPLVEGDNDLTLSTNLENSNPPDILEDEAPLGRPAMSAPTPATAGAGLSGAGGAGHLTSSPISNHSGPEAETKRVPRKKAVALSISSAVDKGDEHYEEKQHQDGKVERIYTNGAREILFPNGTRKQISADGQSIIVSFFNGDIKQILPDQRVVYYYSDAQTTHTTYSDGLEILQFQNNQVEKHYPDGTKEITFPDQTIKYLFPNGTEESIFADGTVIRIEKNGNKTMEFPNGQREIHTTQYKKREYPDGTVKTVYPDGRQETRYSSGRIRVKDREGNIIVDRRM